MKAIRKGGEPRSLVQHRAAAHCTYDNFLRKDELRAALVAEQGGLCCYCMARIRPDADSMKIEHWKCQHAHPGEQLDYRNLLGACLGGEGRPQRLQHCDTRKGDNDLRWNPSVVAHPVEARIRYEVDGTIRSDDPVFDKQLDDVLNLNLPVFKNNRSGILDVISAWCKREKARRKGPVPRDVLESRLSGWTTGELLPFSGVAVWALRYRLARAA